MQNNYKKLFLLVSFIFLAAFANAAEIDVAYVLEDSSRVEQNIIDAFDDLSLNYEIIRDSQIRSTNFSRYNVLLVVEDVSNRDNLPLQSSNMIFLDRRIAREVWNLDLSRRTGQTSGRTVEAYNRSSFVLDGISVPTNNQLVVYNGFPGFELDYLIPRLPSNIRTAVTRSGIFRPIIAYSSTELPDRTIKKLFFGVKNSARWNGNAKIMFGNSLSWMLEEVDRDNDGWPISLDCDDDNENINPDAEEIPYDNVDQNCDGFDLTDLDEDGFDADCDFVDGVCFVENGNDCDDSNPEVNPTSEDLRFNCVNDAPVVEEILPIAAEENSLITIEIHAADFEEDELEYFVDDIRFTSEENIFRWQTNYQDSGVYSFIFTVSDGEFDVERIASIEIGNVNQPPTLISEIPEINFDEDTTFTIDLTDFFEDGDGDELSYGVEFSGSEISYAENEGIVTLMPNANFYGEAEIVFSASDGFSTTFSNEILIRVNNVNDAVEFFGELQNLSWNEDNPLINIVDLDNYFIDVDSELIFSVFGNERVDVEIENGVVSFYPEENFNGIEEIYFEASDGEFTASSNTIELEVIPVGDLPIFNELSCETRIDEDAEYGCEVSAYDVENNEIGFHVGEEQNMECDLEGNILTYKSSQNYFGRASCTIIASNINGETENELLFNVIPVEDSPSVVSSNPAQETVVIPRGTNRVFSIEGADIDSEFSITWKIDGEQVQFNAPPRAIFTFNKDEGEYELETVLSDGEFSVSRVWNIIVGPTEEFTCADVLGSVCNENQICRESLIPVRDSSSCCSVQCEPAFRGADSCSELNNDLEIEIKKPESDDELPLEDKIRLEFKITNNLDEDKKIDLFAHLYNFRREKSEESVEEENIDVEGGRSKTVVLDLDVEEDLNIDEDYALYAKVFGENICNQNYAPLNFGRMEENIKISKFELQDNAVCGEIVEPKVTVENFGSEPQQVILEIKSSKLDVDESVEFELQKFDADNDKKKNSFSLEIPEKISSGEYEVTAAILYGTNKRESQTKKIEIVCERDDSLRGEISTQKTNLDTNIFLNQVQKLESGEKVSQGKISEAFALFFLNILLAASMLLLFAAHKKKQHKRFK